MLLLHLRLTRFKLIIGRSITLYIVFLLFSRVLPVRELQIVATVYLGHNRGSMWSEKFRLINSPYFDVVDCDIEILSVFFV